VFSVTWAFLWKKELVKMSHYILLAMLLVILVLMQILTWKLYKALAPKITGNLKKVWGLEMDVLSALCDMELTGAYIDQEALKTLAEEIEKGKLDAEARCCDRRKSLFY